MESTPSPRGRHDSALVERIVTTVAERERTDVLSLPPLYEAVDADALVRLAGHAGADEVTFSYHGYEVTVADGDVSVRDRRT